jgi:threonyl-tRNA synthetase
MAPQGTPGPASTSARRLAQDTLTPMVEKGDRRGARVAGITSELIAVDDQVRPLATAVHDMEAVHGETWSQLCRIHLGGSTPPPPEPPASLGLVVRSAAAGAGLRTWTPDGALMLRLIEQWMRSFAAQHLGGEEIVTPTLYRWQPGTELYDLAETFEDRLFVSRAGSRAHVLRYSADPGFFGYAASLSLRAEQLPVRLWEYGTFFRRGRDGELRGIQRLHEFRLLDHHTICKAEQAVEEYGRLVSAQIEALRAIAGSVAAEFTVTADGLQPCLPAIRAAAECTGSPSVVELLSERKHYWTMKSFLYVDGPYETCNLQLDTANVERFGLSRQDGDTAVIHATMMSAERMVLITTHIASRLPHPQLPLWLSPVQVRVVPVDPRHGGGVATLDFLRSGGIRAELDDRPRSLPWRISDAARSWIPYTVVVGSAEERSATLDLRYRDGRREQMRYEQVLARLESELAGYPRAELPRRSTRERFWVR